MKKTFDTKSGIEIRKMEGEFSDALVTKTFKSLTFSKIDADFDKVKLTPKPTSDGYEIQAEYFYSEGRVKHKNVTSEGQFDFFHDLIDIARQADLSATSGQATLLISKKGNARFVSNINHGITEQSDVFKNGETKNYIFDGTEDFMKILGISDANGRIHDKKQGKFRQINRFSEQVRDVMKYLPSSGEIFIADLCCGKSYLSFALYHYLSVTLKKEVRMVCVDLKKSVIDYCKSCTDSLGFDGMEFICGDVCDFKCDKSPDLVISLNACDVATDIVLDFAISYGAKVILSTPCCQRELAENLDCEALSFITEYPHLKMKFGALATDALRGKRLEAAGYKVDIIEFTDPESTPKNTMIRAVGKNVKDMSQVKIRKAIGEYNKAYTYLCRKKPKKMPSVVLNRDNEKKLKIALDEAEKGINSPDTSERIKSCEELQKLFECGYVPSSEYGSYVNNHIHTTYSFSPYTPASAVYNAKSAGLRTCGIMDHDSVAGAAEFTKAGKIFKIPTTCGCEMRVKFDIPGYSSRRLNNPDQLGCAYVALHGIPSVSVDEVSKFLVPYREARNVRNAAMIEKINGEIKCLGIEISFDDVLALSYFEKGGSVTERHVLFALVKELVKKYPVRKDCIAAIEDLSGTALSEKKKAMLAEAPERFYEYDLLGIMKSGLIEKIYIPATDELPSVSEYISLARKTGAVSAYAYLGDVGESPTGDKKTQKFEDDYLDELFAVLKETGFNAVTFMPSRNTPSQLERVMSLCKKHGFFMISGEDINSPRQSFICTAAEDVKFDVLKEATWALIGHEVLSANNVENSMFSSEGKACGMTLEEKIKYYSDVGKNTEIKYLRGNTND